MDPVGPLTTTHRVALGAAVAIVVGEPRVGTGGTVSFAVQALSRMAAARLPLPILLFRVPAAA
jgi:hypothetical protein